ncbi:MAG: 50S ribosomal protein L25 [Myxococcales bacterium]|nr:50S ribosomal protein L25 [Myxococcales bacterium]MDH5566430.1 50S ribosomal protein L25 [Myxococcales bacterium]
MSEYELSVEPRSAVGKGVARKLRAAGRVPGVCYGAGDAPQAISLDPRALDRLVTSSAAGVNTLIDLKGGGALAGQVVLVKEIQRDPVSGAMLHADLYTVDANRVVTVSVPIHLKGTAKGLKQGGIVDHALRELELECLPRSIPEEIPVDVTDLDIGDSLHVRDLVLPEGVTLLSDADVSVVSIVSPAAEEAKVEGEPVLVEGAEEGAEAEAGAEPSAGEND